MLMYNKIFQNIHFSNKYILIAKFIELKKTFYTVNILT